MTAYRHKAYKHYSQDAHNRLMATSVGSYAFSIDDPNAMTPSIFGQTDRATYPTLYFLNDSMHYFFNILYRLLNRTAVCPSGAVWKTALSLREVFNVVIAGRQTNSEFFDQTF